MRDELPPWQSRADWEQIESFFRKSLINASNRGKLEIHAATIAQKLEAVDCIFEGLCEQTCTSCADLCCVRASVWYDYRDLLFLYLHTKSLPARQIFREKGQNCPQLNASGCSLQRLQRPFICTWYLCPDQKRKLEVIGKPDLDDLCALLVDIKRERQLMELTFINSVAPNRR
jgi:hypothetical protein